MRLAMHKSRGEPLAVRLRRRRDGAVSVELAIVAVPFLMLLIGVFELALLLLAATALEDATQKAARDIRTGEFQTRGQPTEAQFETLVCGGMSWLPACGERLLVDTRAYPSLSAMSSGLQQPVDPEEPCFEAGGPGQIVLVRTQLRWRIVTPILRPSMAQAEDGTRVLESTTAFRNEPFGNVAAADVCA